MIEIKINNFKIKSYTTKVNAEQSLREIEGFLRSIGSTGVMKQFNSDGVTHTLAFEINDKLFRLPLNTMGVKALLFSGNSTLSQVEKDKRAYRVACRCLREWVHAQLSLIASGQAEPEQVLLPYLYDGKSKKTLYDKYVDNQLQLENR